MNTQSLFKYLKTQKISIDEKEFDFQFSSHPDYPTLLAVSDTLNFFNINNIGLRIIKEEITELPNKFLAKLNTGKEEFFSYVEKNQNEYTYTKEDTRKSASASQEDFKSIWGDIVLLVEDEDNSHAKVAKTKTNSRILLVTALIFLVVLLAQIIPNYYTFFFFILSVVGFLFSITSQKELLNTKIDIVDKFCNIGANTSCTSVLNSKKWRVLKLVGFGDLGIVFFGTQLLGIFTYALSLMLTSYFQIQFSMLVLSIPFLGLSIYYQAFVEKKWCPVCLSIIALVVTQFIYVTFFNGFDFNAINLKSIVVYGFLFSFASLVWFYVKKGFKEKNRLEKSEISLNRFKRNYNTFKLLLTSGKKYDLPKTRLVFGNSEANLKISIITSPFCGHCEEPYKILKKIQKKYGSDIQVSVFFNASPKHERLWKFTNTLINLTIENKKNYFDAMNHWYSIKDNEEWIKYYNLYTSKTDNSLLDEQNKWCSQNDLNFTPCLFINGFRYPRGYKISELSYFINELIDDNI